MVDRDVVLAKLGTIDRCLVRIEEVNDERRIDLLPADIEDITVLNLQRAIQAATNLAIHIVATEGYGTPDSMEDAFTLLERRRMIESELAENLRRMVEFRNRSIYEYPSIGPDIVKGLVEHHLGDLRALGARVVEAFKLCDRNLNGRTPVEYSALINRPERASFLGLCPALETPANALEDAKSSPSETSPHQLLMNSS